MAVIKSHISYNINSGSACSFIYTDLAQTFTTPASGGLWTLTDIVIPLSKSGPGIYDPGNVNVNLYATDINGDPWGASLSSGSVDYDTLTGWVVSSTDTRSTYEITFTMSSYELQENTQYAIVLTMDNYDTGYPPQIMYWLYLANYTMSGGEGLRYSGSWSTYPTTADLEFTVNGTTEGGGSPPTKANTPTPSNGATAVDFSGFQLSWVDGGGSDSYNVYIGETGSLTLVSSAQAGTTYTTTLSELESIYSTSPIDQVIYWRIDSTNENGTTTGDEWNFDARPGKASSPSPASAATGQNLTPALSWTAGTVADTYSLYVDDESKATEISDTGYSDYSGWFDYSTEYTWRLDSVNDFGTTTGDEWTFTTLTYDPPISTWEVITGKTLGPLTGGTEGVDFRWLGTNNMNTVKYIVTAAKDAVHYAEI